METIFERLGDAGVRTACTPFLIYRGRTRHELGLEGLLRRVALAASFRHATWGPDELFYGELYSSRPVDCKPTLARPGTRDEYSACVGRELVEHDLYDFLLFSLPDNDHHSHKLGPEAQIESIARADAAFAELADAAGGLDEFLATHAVIAVADHAQTRVEQPLPLDRGAGAGVAGAGAERASPSAPSSRSSPIARAAAVYVLAEGRRADARRTPRSASRLRRARRGSSCSPGCDGRRGRRCAARRRTSCASGRGSAVDRPPRRRGWDVDGDLGALGRERSTTAASTPPTTPTRSRACGRRCARRTPATS